MVARSGAAHVLRHSWPFVGQNCVLDCTRVCCTHCRPPLMLLELAPYMYHEAHCGLEHVRDCTWQFGWGRPNLMHLLEGTTWKSYCQVDDNDEMWMECFGNRCHFVAMWRVVLYLALMPQYYQVIPGRLFFKAYKELPT